MADTLVPEDPVAEVRARADIVEVISDVVVLKRTGRTFKGLCPFHQERTPSFNVTPERQTFHCFGCGEGGDVFSFVMKSSHLTFPEALKTLADRYGVILPERRVDADERTKQREANELAAEYYSWLLEHPEHGAAGRAYLEGRGIAPEIRRRFRLGLSPNAWDGLYKHLRNKNIAPDVLLPAALIRERQSGDGYYDYFRNRLMFPILNEASQVVGFGARAIAAGDEPKYLNSPETTLYRKGNLLYGLSEARDAIRQRDRVLLMEGYMDVITAHAHGFTETVGVLGTALTPAQARVLLRYTPSRNVILSFDADRAGQQAAERGISTLSEVTQGIGLNVKVLAVPAGKDPDAFLRAEGSAAFADLLANAPDLFQFLVERAVSAHDLRTPEGRAAAVGAVVPVLRQIQNYVTQDHYVNALSERLGVRSESIRLEIGRGLRHNVAPSRPVAGLSAKKLSTREAERILLFFMVERPAVREVVASQLADIPFEPLHQAIRHQLAAIATPSWDALTEVFIGEPENQQAIAAISFADYEAWGDEPDRVVEDCILTLQIAFWRAQQADWVAKLKDPDQQTVELLTYNTRRFEEVRDYLVELERRRWGKTG